MYDEALAPRPDRQPVAGPGGLHRYSARLARLAMWVLYIPVALLGALVMTPMAMSTVVPAVALAAVGLLAVLFRTCRRPGPDRRTSTTTAAAAAGVAPFSEGIELLQDTGTVIGMTVLALLAYVGNSWWATNLDVDPAGDATEPAAARSLRQRLRRMPLEDVFREWQAMQHGTGVPPDARHMFAAAQVRSLVLDELEHRDPVGFGCWLGDGAVDPPEHHIRGDQGLAA